jgi:hypothetical protein
LCDVVAKRQQEQAGKNRYFVPKKNEIQLQPSENQHHYWGKQKPPLKSVNIN